MENQQQHLDLGFSGHCLLWTVLTCQLCQNCAKELPGSHSSTFTLFLGVAWPGALQQSLSNVLQWSSLWSCTGAIPRTWDAVCVPRGAAQHLTPSAPSAFPPFPRRSRQQAGAGLAHKHPTFKWFVCHTQHVDLATNLWAGWPRASWARR